MAWEVIRQAGGAALQLLLTPYYYVAILLIMLQYMRQTRMMRKLFHVRLHAWPQLLMRTVLSGIVVGFFISCAGLFLGVSVTGEAVLWMWGTAAVLAAASVRYLCFAYSVGILGVLQWLLLWIPLAERGDWIGTAAASLGRLDIPGLLVLVALMHLAEALLVRMQGARFANPLFLEGKRGKLIGGYMLQGYWPVPLLMLVPGTASGSGVDVGLPWTTLLDSSFLGSGGWTMVGFPMMIGFTEMTRTMLPKAKARAASSALLLYALLVGAVAVGAAFWSPLTVVAALCALLLHEMLVLMSRLRETTNSPFYVHNEQGLRVLAVIPGTPAEAMGILAGEVLHKVNGLKVRTIEELYAALHVHSAFCKLEVFNLEGQLKFVQRARYANEHHQLGVILAPDEKADFYAAPGAASLLDLFRGGRTARQRETTTSI
ncbi:PDZ domain-containing protein [Paenibacillus mendelii]|uniref:PDZ domain-containing protein n=1 Tax=Paenibacillus mendelii TaxID=206163 RepID=A0ABV6J614_9BACL|nr:PDZ domain-containing protein [Paenibacillus mendelii]MCQ6563594.1 PDZ domain-containing protein [Paenibacillus mendelii]